MHKFLGTTLLLVLLSTGLTARDSHISVAGGGGAGYMLNGLDIYTNLLNTKIYGHGFLELGYQTRADDNEFYSWAFNHPEMGFGLSYTGTGALECKNGSRLGDLYTVYGFFRCDIVKGNVFSFGPYLNFGLTYTPVKYDYYTNPYNTYVGSNLVILSALGLDGRFHLTRHLDIGIKAMLAHRSNGMLKVPNHGLNKFESGIYLRYSIAETPTGKRIGRPAVPEFKNWNWDVYCSGGVHSCDAERVIMDPPDCKSWLRMNVGGNVYYRYHPIFSTGAGVDLFYTGNAPRLEECELVRSGQKVSLSPLYCGIYLMQNFHYRNVMVTMGFGAYLYKNLGPEDSKWNYQRISARFYIPSAGDIFVGFGMRAHSFDRSDTLEFIFGKKF